MNLGAGPSTPSAAGSSTHTSFSESQANTPLDLTRYETEASSAYSPASASHPMHQTIMQQPKVESPGAKGTTSYFGQRTESSGLFESPAASMHPLDKSVTPSPSRETFVSDLLDARARPSPNATWQRPSSASGHLSVEARGVPPYSANSSPAGRSIALHDWDPRASRSTATVDMGGSPGPSPLRTSMQGTHQQQVAPNEYFPSAAASPSMGGHVSLSESEVRALLASGSLDFTFAPSNAPLPGLGVDLGLQRKGGRIVPAPPGQPGPAPHNRKIDLYKTELCRQWEEKGTCRYGAKCQFAHGSHELRPVERHRLYKTQICRTYFLTGSCPYARRCCFVHMTPAMQAGAVKEEEGTPKAPLLARLGASKHGGTTGSPNGGKATPNSANADVAVTRLHEALSQIKVSNATSRSSSVSGGSEEKRAGSDPSH